MSYRTNKQIKLFFLSLVCSLILTPLSAFARHPDFYLPKELKPRVGFWIDIFSRYGKDQVLVHHTDFPQAVFGVIDFRSQSKKMSPRNFEQYKSRVKNEKTRAIENALAYLATGKSPRTPMEKLVKEVMEVVPGGHGKYRKAYQEKLVRTQTGISERYREALERSGRYMHILTGVFRSEGLPIELTRLPFIESSFDYKAYSSVGAAGIWQFMSRTARSFGMKVDNLIDERRDIVSATRAASKYLKSAYKELGTWPLALTSYNHGVGGVRSKVKKLGTKQIEKIVEHPSVRLFGFASTNFYPEFLAALEIYDNPGKYFPGIKVEPPRELVEYRLPVSFGASHLSKILGISIETLMEYNYAVSSKVWKGYYHIPAGYVLKLPLSQESKLALIPSAAKQVATAYKNNTQTYQASSTAGAGYYIIRRGDTLSSIAKKHGMSTQTLQKLNGLNGASIYAGQKLKVSSATARTNSQNKITTKATVSSATHYVVRKGDSLWSIASKHGLSINSLKAINGLKGNSIRIGQKLRVS